MKQFATLIFIISFLTSCTREKCWQCTKIEPVVSGGTTTAKQTTEKRCGMTEDAKNNYVKDNTFDVKLSPTHTVRYSMVCTEAK